LPSFQPCSSPQHSLCLSVSSMFPFLLACISSLFLPFPSRLGLFGLEKIGTELSCSGGAGNTGKRQKTISYYSMVGYVFRSVPQFFISPVASILFIAYFFPFPLVLFGISTTAVSLFTGIFYYALEKAKNISEEIENAMRRPRAPEVEEINT